MHDSVDKSWHAFLGATEIRSPGVRVVTDAPALAGYRGVYFLRIGDGLVIGAPPDVDLDVASKTPDELFTREAAAEVLGQRAGLVLGPSRHHYADATTFVRPDA